MDRSRSKRSYQQHHDQDYDSETLARTKPRYSHHDHDHHHPHYPRSRQQASRNSRHHHRRSGGGSKPGKVADQSLMSTTGYKILCHDDKAGGVIGKSGSIVKAIRQHTGAWINVHELASGDNERVIEISDARRLDPEGRMPAFSPAQEALLLIHERILESDTPFGGRKDDGDSPQQLPPQRGRVTSRLVVSRMHVGSLLGKGGKIVEKMRMDTKTQIRVLPRDHNLPRCVSISEEVVQVVGDPNAVKNAMLIISSRLRESQHRDRSHFHGRLHSPERIFPPDDDDFPHINKASHPSSIEGSSFGLRLSSSSTSLRDNEPGAVPVADVVQPYYSGEIVFRILCPINKVDSVIGDPDGIIGLLQNEIGVDIHVADHVAGSDEQIIVISSEEGPDDELFPAQEALLHIQTRIVDLIPDEDTIITTRLLVSSSEVGCLEGRDGSLSEMRRVTGANIQILPKESVPASISRTDDELVEIVGEIKAARDALVEVTSRLRSYLYREFFPKDMLPGPPGNALAPETTSPNEVTLASEGYPSASYQNVTSQLSKESGVSHNGSTKQKEGERCEDVPSGLCRVSLPLVTRSILEVVIPEKAVPKLVTKSKNMLAQFSELSGAKVTLLENGPEDTEKTIQISGTREQAEKAQSLLQGFILSI